MSHEIFRDNGYRPLLIKPRLRASKEHRSPTWFDLLYDLLFVDTIARLRHSYHLESSTGILEFFVLFIPIYWQWFLTNAYLNRYDTEDLFHAIYYLINMIFLGGVSFNIIPCSEHDSQFTEFHCKQFALFLGLLRSVHVIVFLRVIHHIPQVRFYSWMQTAASMVVTACWITMFFVEDIPVLFIALWLTTICVDLFIFFVLDKFPCTSRNYPSVNGHLFQHRTGLFILLSLGQLIVDGLDIELEKDTFDWSIITNSALAISLAFIVKLLYFDVGQATNPKWNKTAERLFVLLHVPFNGAIVLSGVGPSQLLRQGTMTSSALYVFLGAMAVISLFFAVSLALQRGATKGSKFSRVAIRIVAAIMLVILTLAPRSHLPGTALLALAVGIMALIFVWDLVFQIVNNRRWKQQLRDTHDEEQVKLLEEVEEEKFLVHGSSENTQHTFPGQ